MASDTVAMVLAVNWAPQAPADGQATCSSVVEVGVGHLADRVLANGLEHVLHGDRPALEGAGQDRAAVDEYGRHIEAHMAIIMPGSDLSQPARPTSAS